MSDSPRTERSQTRFSTPVNELDDHRNQPQSLPLAVESSPRHPGTRRGTVATIASANNESHNPDLLAVNENLRQHGLISRDFEESAVVDDDTPLSAYARRGSAASPTARRNTFRRPRDPDMPPRSRGSSHASRSESPPNSVDAFATERQRPRAGTATSGRSNIDLPLHRTVSGGTHERRPTFSCDERPLRCGTDVSSLHSGAEVDVCFPVREDAGKTYQIDYEELEEFVAESHLKTPIRQLTRHASNASRTSKRTFNDLRAIRQVPTIVTPDMAIDVPDYVDKETGSIKGSRAPSTAAKQSIAETPNRWTFFSSELDDTIHAAELGDLLMPGETFRDLFELSPDGGVWWLDMSNPTEEEVFAICKAFGVHPLTREDITTQEAREKVELFNRYYFLCFRSFDQNDKTSEDYLEPVNVYGVVFREGLLTFSFTANPHAANVRKRISRLRDYVSLSSDWICYALIDDIVDHFAPVIKDVEDETDAIEDSVFIARAEDSRDILRSIGNARKKVMTLLRLLGGKADVVKGFAKRCNEKFEVTPRGDVGLYLSDIQDHVVTMMSNLGHFEKMLSRSHGNYLAQINVESAAQGNEINKTLGKVTLIATVLVPLNLICGLFGMNVPVPGMNSDSLGWFFGILGVILFFVVSSLATARRMRLI
ncbi:magnesium transporter ALR1 [Pseudovirgaria hyperparasitica]|uniref:Magnesium transporter ALR1 n=1 Tax=Pseudovirgaria hyperparasitica TaxID=470096 RepID=A0A6A6W0W7_9PEZI|nr:magnesium transporter ALR1 [Pseudovirgaria hyperparasitica]KAF2756155.1 magnesium transporter ALR1 [Pseudovirgaria hyperparasitica]